MVGEKFLACRLDLPRTKRHKTSPITQPNHWSSVCGISMTREALMARSNAGWSWRRPYLRHERTLVAERYSYECCRCNSCSLTTSYKHTRKKPSKLEDMRKWLNDSITQRRPQHQRFVMYTRYGSEIPGHQHKSERSETWEKRGVEPVCSSRKRHRGK